MCLNRLVNRFTDKLRARSGDASPKLEYVSMERIEPYRSPAENRMLGADVLLKTIQAIAAAVDAKSLFSSEHSSRVTQLCLEIGAELGLPRDSLETLEFAAHIHDIGKIGTPDSVLTKIGRLTDDDWSNIREHPGVGAGFLSRIGDLQEVAHVIRHHHERMDGFGYPDRLRGEAIPLLSRVLAVADAFEAMTSNRPHRRAINPNDALQELRANAGAQFDSDVVKAAATVIERGYLGQARKTA